MNIKALQTFLTVLEAGTLSAAAHTLRISQPAISKQLKALESELGVQLLVRGRRGVVELTPAGRLLREYAENVLRQYQSLLATLTALKEQSAGILHIAASTTPGHFFLPKWLSAFQQRRADIQTHLFITNSAGVLERLRAGQADLGFIGSEVADPELVCTPVVQDEIVVAVPAGHPFASREVVSRDDLLSEHLILREPGSGTRQCVEQQFTPQEQEKLGQAAILELGSTHAVLAAVAAGAGIGFLSRLALDERGRPDVVPVRVQGFDGRRHLYLVYPRDRAEWPPLRAFVGFILHSREPA
ncbi:MAG: LysR substrate-binding domain-containing protein [Anaerolineae bacterium]